MQRCGIFLNLYIERWLLSQWQSHKYRINSNRELKNNKGFISQMTQMNLYPQYKISSFQSKFQTNSLELAFSWFFPPSHMLTGPFSEQKATGLIWDSSSCFIDPSHALYTVCFHQNGSKGVSDLYISFCLEFRCYLKLQYINPGKAF